MSYFDDVIEPSLYRKPRHIVRKESGILWTTKEGKSLFVHEMTDSHLSNAINAIKRRLGTPEERTVDVSTFETLLKEQRKRENNA